MARERTSAIQAPPEMHDGVGAERAPAFVVRRAAQRLEGAPDGHVAWQERVAVAERAHGYIGDGPRPDPRYREEPGTRLDRVRARIDAKLAGRHEPGHLDERGPARPGEGKARGAAPREPAGIEPAVLRDHTTQHGAGSRHRHLLADDRPDRQLEAVDRARHAE